jgi:hypothetical protein
LSRALLAVTIARNSCTCRPVLSRARSLLWVISGHWRFVPGRPLYQLDNLDTAYKRELLTFLSDNFRWDDYTPAGELELVNDGTTVEATLILMSEWKTKLPKLIAAEFPPETEGMVTA